MSTFDGAEILDEVAMYLQRFVSYPSKHACFAHTLWLAHTHLIECFDTTPRLGFMSAEKESGKTRALEISELFVPSPIFSFNASPAVIMRLVASERRTLLYDEIDQVFGTSKAREANAELCGYLNSGYRRGAKAYRCALNGNKVEPEQFDAFAAVAVAGLKDLPDTLASRTIFIRMKRRAPDESVESFRHRYHPPQAKPKAEALARWCAQHKDEIAVAKPELPAGIEDRTADCWEPLLAIADAAGEEWPQRAREAAIFLSARAADETLSNGVELLQHIKEAFGGEEKLTTKQMLERLIGRHESPWSDIYGKPLNDRGLSKRLKNFGIKSKDVAVGGKCLMGYTTELFHDAWKRYLPAPAPAEADKADEPDNIDNNNNYIGDIGDIGDNIGKSNSKAHEAQVLQLRPNLNGNRKTSCQACDGKGCPTCRPRDYGIGDSDPFAILRDPRLPLKGDAA